MPVCPIAEHVCVCVVVCVAGELGKLEMLHEGILHQCIKQLLAKKKQVAVADHDKARVCHTYSLYVLGCLLLKA